MALSKLAEMRDKTGIIKKIDPTKARLTSTVTTKTWEIPRVSDQISSETGTAHSQPVHQVNKDKSTNKSDTKSNKLKDVALTPPPYIMDKGEEELLIFMKFVHEKLNLNKYETEADMKMLAKDNITTLQQLRLAVKNHDTWKKSRLPLLVKTAVQEELKTYGKSNMKLILVIPILLGLGSALFYIWKYYFKSNTNNLFQKIITKKK